jgi:hypothetical protein
VSDVVARRPSVELSIDRRFAGRVRRLALTSVVALGIIWSLSVTTVDAPPVVDIGLLAGWLLMPSILVASLAEPRWRYALVVPASLVGISLLAISVAWHPPPALAAVGWSMTTAGVLLGGWLGLWFWFRLVPVPKALDDPFSPGRSADRHRHAAGRVDPADSPWLTPPRFGWPRSLCRTGRTTWGRCSAATRSG